MATVREKNLENHGGKSDKMWFSYWDVFSGIDDGAVDAAGNQLTYPPGHLNAGVLVPHAGLAPTAAGAGTQDERDQKRARRD